jgi:hypothetical protein
MFLEKFSLLLSKGGWERNQRNERKKFVPTQFSLGLSKELVKEIKGMKERKKFVPTQFSLGLSKEFVKEIKE